jgi:ABC-type polysaccharide/polyol phosphate export permease
MSKIKGMAKEAYGYRHILYSMVVRNLKGRYKSSYLGFAWHFITPVILIIIFYIVFTGIMGRPIENYWAYLCVGMFPFTFFQTNLGSGANCIVSEGGTIKKMYFPRELVVLSHIASTFIMFMMAYAAVIVLIILAGIPLSAGTAVYLPVILVLSVIFATGYTLFFSAITVFVRDIHHLIDATTRVLYFMTPVFYLVSDVAGALENVIWYNPFTHFIVVYQDILYYGVAPEMFRLGVCLMLSLAAMAVGYIVFSRLKGRFAEVL